MANNNDWVDVVNTNRTSKILARAPSIRRRMGEAVKGNAKTSKILARAPSIRRRMGEAQRSKSPAPQQQDNPNYDERGQNEVDRGGLAPLKEKTTWRTVKDTRGRRIAVEDEVGMSTKDEERRKKRQKENEKKLQTELQAIFNTIIRVEDGAPEDGGVGVACEKCKNARTRKNEKREKN